MADVKLKGYGESAGSALTTELNSITTASYSNASSAIDNSSTLYPYMDLELYVTYGTNPSTGGYVAAYLLPSVDGTNYPDGSSSVTPAAELIVASFSLRATTSAQRLAATGIPVPSGLFKLMIGNFAGQTMAASGNTLKYRRYMTQVV